MSAPATASGRTRLALGVAGAAMAAYGLWRLLGVRGAGSTLWWLAGGVLAHDALIAPTVVVAAFVGARVLAPAWWGPLARGLLVLGSLTLVAVPVLGGFGARPDNPTLLDRPYWLGWGLIALVTVVLTGLGVAAAAHRGRDAGEGGSRG